MPFCKNESKESHQEDERKAQKTCLTSWDTKKTAKDEKNFGKSLRLREKLHFHVNDEEG